MTEKIRFKPVITRIKLNPEQAVLACGCYGLGRKSSSGGTTSAASTCMSTKRLSRAKQGANATRS